MRIFEEYKKRHKIDMPLVYYPNKGCFIFKADKNKWNSYWGVLTITWENCGPHPGKYLISFRSPSNKMGNQDLFNLYQNHFSTQKDWSEYEDYIYGFLKKTKTNELSPILNEEAIFLSSWEIFVCCYENWFFNQSFVVKSFLFNTLDLSASVNERINSIKKFLELDVFKESNLFKIWDNKFLKEVKNNYLFWFGDI